MRRMRYLLIVLFIFSITAHADKGGYTVEPYLPEDNPGDSLIDTSGADATISFRDLPLWIKITYLSGLVLGFSGLLKFAFVIFGRIKNLLKNENRKCILEYIMNNPGCTIAEISQQNKINRGSVKYHVRKLESEEQIALVKEDKFVRLFENSSIFDDKEKLIAAYVNNETSRLLLCHIIKNPGITNKELASKFNLSKSGAYWHVQRFLNDGIIISKHKGANKKYYVDSSIEKIVRRFAVQ